MLVGVGVCGGCVLRATARDMAGGRLDSSTTAECDEERARARDVRASEVTRARSLESSELWGARLVCVSEARCMCLCELLWSTSSFS